MKTSVSAVPGVAAEAVQPAASVGVAAGAPRSSRLVVGVTGHRLRHFNPATLAHVRTSLHGAVGAITDAFQQESGAGELRLISSLASGSDSIAADAALERGWTLDAVLPIHHEGYAEDFGDSTELADFRRQTSAAQAVFELPGETAGGAEYERAGRIMLDHCDIMLAVWDGRPARGRGGSEQILSEAIERHLPVLLIDAAALRATEILWTGFDKHGLRRTQTELIGRRPLDVLPELLAELGGRDMEGPTAAEVSSGSNFAVAYPLLLALVGVRRFRANDLRHPASKTIEASLIEVYSGACARTGAFGRRLQALLGQYAAADAVATHMSQLYRSGFVANFSLAAAAVLLALAGLVLSPVARPLLTAGEMLVVASILWLTHVARKREWHARWIGERHFAERLRCLVVAAQLGGPGAQLASASAGQLGSRLRQSVRALGLPTARADPVYLDCVRDELIRLLNGQIDYHRGAARQMHTLDHRLHRLGTILFSLSALSCLGVLGFEIARDVIRISMLETTTRSLTLTATIVGAALPALGAAIYGIRMQGDFSGAASRAHELATALQRLKTGVEIERQEEPGLAFDHLRHAVRHAADLMGSELTDWRNAQQARPLTLPG